MKNILVKKYIDDVLSLINRKQQIIREQKLGRIVNEDE